MAIFHPDLPGKPTADDLKELWRLMYADHVSVFLQNDALAKARRLVRDRLNQEKEKCS